MEAIFKKRLGSRIRLLRTSRGMTQEELGSRIDRTPEAISNIERGEVLPQLETLSRISVALGVPVSELLLGVGAVDGPPKDENEREKLDRDLMELARKLSNEDVRLQIYQVKAIIQFRKDRAIKMK